MFLSLERFITGAISAVMGNRYVKSGENKMILFIDANKLYCYSMMEYLPHGEFRFDIDFKLDNRFNTPDGNEDG